MENLRKILILCVILSLTACNQVTPQGDAPALMDGGLPEFAATIAPTATHPAILPTATVVDLPTPTVNPYLISTAQPTETVVAGQQLNPLTGLAVTDPEILNRRPVMVKLANWPREERPQAGLSQADMVFEYSIGHQMNQFLALYYGEDAEAVGPARSGQLVDAQLASFYHGFLVYGNAVLAADEVIDEDLGPRALKFGDLPCPPLCGVDALSGDAFVDTAALTDYVNQIGLENDQPDLAGLAFQEEPPLGDGSGELVQVTYADFSIMQWRYNEGTRSYSLWVESEGQEGLTLAPMTDRNDGQLLRFENIVVMYATYKSYTDTLHDILLTDQTGYQGMLLFRDGLASFGNWRTPEVDQPILFEMPEGEALFLKPGKTWVVIVSQSSITNQVGGGQWEIGFGE